MCTGPELQQLSPPQTKPGNEENMNLLTVETEDLFSSLLELAANNDIAGFKRSIDRDANAIDEIDVWYGRQNFSNQMLLVHRTPLMVAATYGSLDVLNLILALSSADLNRTCGPDKSTALHCAASGGSIHAVDAVRLLLAAGADPTAVDARGRRPADVIVVPPKFQNMKHPLEELLLASPYSSSSFLGLASLSNSGSSSPPLSSSPDNESPSSATGSTSSPMMGKLIEIPPQSEKKEYPVDPSLPDIKNSIYATDEFRMFSFKVRPCSRAYSHDWTECPFVHPGENARRRDPRKFHYSCVPCPDFRKGACRRGDLCEYAHGVFECWLHPAQYRTRLCKDGTSCLRRVCFFAHTSEELRPLYVSTGSASPRSAASAAMEMAAAMSLLPGSPSSVSVMSPSPFASPMSPSANGLSRASSMAWPQPNVPTLHLPGSNFQSSRLRSSLNARDIPSEEFSMSHEFDALNDFSCISSQSRLSSCAGNRSFRSKTFTPSNLDELFNAEMSSSPRYSDQVGPVFSPNSNKSAILAQFQQQQQSMLSPINTNNVFSPKAIDQHSFLHSSFGISSPGRMSPCSVEPVSPMSSRMAELVQREKQQQQLRSLSFGGSNANVVGSPLSNANSWSKWGSNGKLDWGVNSEELGRFQRSSSSLEPGANGEEPDLSWVQSLVKESPPEKKEKQSSTAPAPVSGDSPSGEGNNSNSQLEAIDHSVLGAWLEQMQLDQLVA